MKSCEAHVVLLFKVVLIYRLFKLSYVVYKHTMILSA